MSALLKDLKAQHPLRAARLDRGLTQGQVALRAGVSQASVSRIESGGRVCGGALVKIAETLDVPALELLDDAQRELAVVAARAALEVFA